MVFFEKIGSRHSFERWTGFKTSRRDFKVRSQLLELAIQQAQCNGLAIDLGCGDGIWIKTLTKFFDQVIGIDRSHSFINQAQNEFKHLENVNFHCDDILEESFFVNNNIDRKADFIFCNHVLEYVKDEAAFWSYIQKISQTGTILCIVTKNGYPNIWRVLKLATFMLARDSCPQQKWRKLDKALPQFLMLKECFFLDVRLPVHLSDINDSFTKKEGVWDNIGAAVSMKLPLRSKSFNLLKHFAWHIAVIAVVK